MRQGRFLRPLLVSALSLSLLLAFTWSPILCPSTSNNLPQLSLQGGLAVAWDWLVMIALTLWIGLLVMQGVTLRDEKDDNARGDRSEETRGDRQRETPAPTFFAQLRKQALPLQWLCLAALFAGEIINLVLRATLLTQAYNNNGIDPQTIRQLIVDTKYGHLWLVRIALIAISIGFLWWTTHSGRAQFVANHNTGGMWSRTRASRPAGH